jgi:hypothetical protein
MGHIGLLLPLLVKESVMPRKRSIGKRSVSEISDGIMIGIVMVLIVTESIKYEESAVDLAWFYL